MKVFYQLDAYECHRCHIKYSSLVPLIDNLEVGDVRSGNGTYINDSGLMLIEGRK